MAGQTCAGIGVHRAGQRLMDAIGFLTAAIGLARHVDDGDQRALVRLVAIRLDGLIHRLGQAPAFEQADLAIAGAGEGVVGIGDHRQIAHRLPRQFTIGYPQRGRQTLQRLDIASQGLEPVQAALLLCNCHVHAPW